MYPRNILALVPLASAVLAGVLNVNIYTESDASSVDAHHDQQVLAKTKEEDQPGWKKRDDLHLVPLVPEARTEVLPVEVEEALIYAVGPRFANEFIKAGAALAAGNVSDLAASCNPLKCAGTVIKAAPCIAGAIACKCPDPIIGCPVNLKNICGCVGCLPKVLQDLLAKFGVCKGSLPAMASLPQSADQNLDYSDFIPFSLRSSNLLAYRGDLPETTLAEAKGLALNGLCPGAPCGSCSCCLGVCILGECVGACLPFNAPADVAHSEL